MDYPGLLTLRNVTTPWTNTVANKEREPVAKLHSHQTRGPRTVSGKDQRVNILGSVCHMASVTTTQTRSGGVKTVKDKT